MSIRSANETCLKRIQESTANLVDVRLASEVVPGLSDYTVLHAGPPVTWDKMCGPMRGATIGACLYEGWAKTPDDAIALADSGKLSFDSCHSHDAIGPMSGIITPSMKVHVVRNERFDLERYSTLYMGVGKVLRHGAYDDSVIEKLHWMNGELADIYRAAIHRAEGIDLKNIIAQALQMGDELHNRNKASNPLFQVALFPHLVQVGSADTVTRVAEFIEQAGHFILNSVMASCKAMLDAGANVPESTIVTAIARNGVETGIRVSGTGDEWAIPRSPNRRGWVPSRWRVRQPSSSTSGARRNSPWRRR
jgi:hypothetical protein